MMPLLLLTLLTQARCSTQELGGNVAHTLSAWVANATKGAPALDASFAPLF